MKADTLELNEAPSNTGAWRGVFFDGPHPDRDPDGEEIPVWFVYIGDEDSEPKGQVYRCHNFKGAQDLAQRMARDRRLELINGLS